MFDLTTFFWFAGIPDFKLPNGKNLEFLQIKEIRKTKCLSYFWWFCLPVIFSLWSKKSGNFLTCLKNIQILEFQEPYLTTCEWHHSIKIFLVIGQKINKQSENELQKK